MPPVVIPGVIEFTEPEIWAVMAAMVMMVMDIVTGFAGAVITGAVSSTKMREGIGHKAMLIMLVVLAVLVQTFSLHIGDMGWSIPMILPVCVYIIVMEVASVVENAVSAYPELKDSPLVRLFDRTTDSSDREEVEQ